jgi:ATP synthase F1 delta subunit
VATKKIVDTYAKSLFQNVNKFKQNNSATNFELAKITLTESKNFVPNIFIIGEELVLISSTIASSKKMKQFFNNPTYAEQQKLNILLSIFPGLTETMKSFLKILTERSHLYLIPEINEEYNKFLLKYKNVAKVKLLTASLLEEHYGSLLSTKLKQLTKANEVILNVAYSPKLLGGIILEYNSMSIDASVLKEFSLFFTDV